MRLQLWSSTEQNRQTKQGKAEHLLDTVCVLGHAACRLKYRTKIRALMLPSSSLCLRTRSLQKQVKTITETLSKQKWVHCCSTWTSVTALQAAVLKIQKKVYACAPSSLHWLGQQSDTFKNQ
jgi:hypothetical protein